MEQLLTRVLYAVWDMAVSGAALYIAGLVVFGPFFWITEKRRKRQRPFRAV